ncbi:MAG: IS630 family transposase [Leptospiraceae bacterium]|nr:IS630 family transposase [Leptospiraceae bacterium]
MEIPLSEADRIIIKKIHRTTKDKRIADRIKIINLLDRGYNSIEIAAILMLDEDTVSNWKKKFIESKNMEDWLALNFIPYKGKLQEIQLMELKQHILESIITDSKQLIPYIKEKFGAEYSERGVRNLLKLLKFSYKQLVRVNPSVEPEIQNQFYQGFESLIKNLGNDEAVLFCDGVHPQHNTHTSKAWIQIGTEKHIPCNTGRQRLNLNGAYNPISSEVFIVESEKVNTQSTILLFDRIQAEYKDKAYIYIITDNARYYLSQELKNYLKDSRIVMIHLPPYSPNLNLIERLWKFMRKKVINSKYYPNFSGQGGFREAILDFFKNIHSFKDELQIFIGKKMQILYPDYPKTTMP